MLGFRCNVDIFKLTVSAQSICREVYERVYLYQYIIAANLIYDEPARIVLQPNSVKLRNYELYLRINKLS